MQLDIGKDKLVKQVQTQFNVLYQYLKIDFFKTTAVDRKQRMYANDIMIVNGSEPRSVNVKNTRTVTELKKDFKTFFSLDAEIHRKSGTVWIETSLTEDWTLEQQNREGELISMLTQV